MRNGTLFAMSQLPQPQLSERQADFVRAIVQDGLSVGEAGRVAGYTSQSAWSTIRLPAVVHAIHQAIAGDLMSIAAPAAFKVAMAILKNEKASERVRADIAFKFMDRAGHITPSNKGSQPQKALSEMSRDEMLAYIDRNQAEIDKIERELAERATDVSAPVIAPSIKTIDTKALNYLD